MLDTYELQMVDKMNGIILVLTDALERAVSDFNEDGVEKDQLAYAHLQLCRAQTALDKIRTYVLGVRTHRLQQQGDYPSPKRKDRA